MKNDLTITNVCKVCWSAMPVEVQNHHSCPVMKKWAERLKATLGVTLKQQENDTKARRRARMPSLRSYEQ